MNSPPTLQEVYDALSSLYHNPDRLVKERASAWLGALQKSVYAWQIADELLQARTSIETCYFAAQTMRIKIQMTFHELPEDSHAQLKDSLIGYLKYITQDTAIIMTQLCLALADLVLQVSAWKNPIPDFLTTLGNSAQLLPALLELLTVFPEEANCRILRLGANRRNEITIHLTDSSPQVLEFLAKYLMQGDSRVQSKIFRCLGSWFQLGVVPFNYNENLNILLATIFQQLSNPDCSSSVHDIASDCMCNALVLLEDSQKYTIFSGQLFEGVYSLLDAYQSSVAQEDIEKSVNYCRIFTELAESVLEEIVDNPGNGLGNLHTMNILLICVAHHDYMVSEITFNFWYRLSESLYKKDNEELNEMFKSYIERLIVSLCGQCQLEPDFEGVPDERDSFGSFRQRVAELIKDVVFVVGSAKCFAQMFENLNSANVTWDVTEASLFVMATVAKNIVSSENVIVPQILKAILSLPPSTHKSVFYTSIQLLGELGDWLDKHPEYVDPVFQFLLSALKEKQLSVVASNSILSLCMSECALLLKNHFQTLLNGIQLSESLNLSQEAVLSLIKGVTYLLTRMGNHYYKEGVTEMCQIQFSAFQKILLERPHSDTHKPDPSMWLDRLSNIFRNAGIKLTENQIHPLAPMLEVAWPLLSQILTRHKEDVKIIERCCRCLRFMIRCVGKQSAVLLEPLVTQIVELYTLHHHSCFLYLGSILVDEFGSEAVCHQGLLDMMRAFCTPTFSILEQPQGMRNHPDTVDDFFRLCSRFLLRCPLVLFESALIVPIINCGLVACTLDHKDANSSVMKFFNELLQTSYTQKDSPNIGKIKELSNTILIENGQRLVSTLVHAAIFSLPTYVLPEIGDVLYGFVKLFSQYFRHWLENALNNFPPESRLCSTSATPNQLREFHEVAISAPNAKMLIASLRELTRLYR